MEDAASGGEGVRRGAGGGTDDDAVCDGIGEVVTVDGD